MNEELTLESLEKKVADMALAGVYQAQAGLILVEQSERQDVLIETLAGEVQELKMQNQFLRKTVDNLLRAVYGPDFIRKSGLFD